MYFVRPQRNKIRNNQEEHKKICKYIEIEQHTPEYNGITEKITNEIKVIQTNEN